MLIDGVNEDMTGQIQDASKEIEKPISQAPAIIPGSMDMQALMAQAIEKGTGVETIERLLAMVKDIKAENARLAFFEALARFQEECPEIIKTKRVKFNSKSGKSVNYTYAPLEVVIKQIKNPLKRNGFSIRFKTKQKTIDAITVICWVHHEQGHKEFSPFTIPTATDSCMNAQQRQASALTFAKRQSLLCALGITTADEDDDAQGAGDPVEPLPQKTSHPGNIPSPRQVTPEKKSDDEASAECKKLLKECFALVRTREKGIDIFVKVEKEQHVMAANKIYSNQEALQALYNSLEIIVTERIEKMRGVVDNQGN